MLLFWSSEVQEQQYQVTLWSWCTHDMSFDEEEDDDMSIDEEDSNMSCDEAKWI